MSFNVSSDFNKLRKYCAYNNIDLNLNKPATDSDECFSNPQTPPFKEGTRIGHS